jgi:hypothetical protein
LVFVFLKKYKIYLIRKKFYFMFRRSFARRGHQLIKEPLPNSEHNTFARGHTTFQNMSQEMAMHAAGAAIGLTLAAYALVSSSKTVHDTVSSTGVVVTPSKKF